jgi:dephospho-CoA kinase
LKTVLKNPFLNLLYFMLKVGLTGGMGSGKTAVAAVFNVFGIPVFDADKQAKLVMEEDEQLIASIQTFFGQESYINGKLNRAFIANIVFNDPAKLELLNSIVHPATIFAANTWMSAQTTPYVIKEAALLFESGSAAQLDYIIGVHSPTALRIKRVMDRDHVTREQVLARMKRQINEEIKMRLCDFVIVNDEQQLVIPQVLKLHQRFLDEVKSRK